ncbi:Ff.00g039680.m01.CDS01 [Fusarium sp. VM40]|nr:Ff.00g039680.m01.CDS01 [Fusarium sp. VM40]
MSTISETQPERISVAQFSAQAKGEILASEFGHPSVQANELVDVTNDKVVNGVDTPASHSTQEQTSRPETVASYPVSDLKLEDRCIDDFRPLRVAVIGAGLSGILSGILLPLKVPEIQLTIFERSRDVGGTWLENVYPGVRCDIPSHVYQTTFDPNLNWSEQFAEGAEILDYWKSLATKYDIARYLRMGTYVETAQWDDTHSTWALSLQDVDSKYTSVERFDFVITGIGRFNEWKLPDYPGINDFKGHLRHTSNWDPTYDPTNKRVAVIGNGASGIQLVPELQKTAKHIDHYARNKTWIAAGWGGRERQVGAEYIPKDQIDSFGDPDTYLKFRKDAEDRYWRGANAMKAGTKENADYRERFIDIMYRRLEKKPGLAEKMIPDFSPHCRRLTPGPGYLEALTENNLEYIQTPISKFTATGIETVDGAHREVDAIFCATGHNVDFAPPFSIRARGVDLKTAWKPGGEIGYPKTYLGMASAGFPNLFYIGTVHTNGIAGTFIHSIENQITYYAKVLRKVSSEGIKTITPSAKAVDDFISYADAYFPTTVMTGNCSSWANGGRPGARIHGAWPGSASHLTFVRRNPRWEDFEYEYVSGSGNRFAYYGNGRTVREADPNFDITSYLKRDPAQIDLRDIHETWHSWP